MKVKVKDWKILRYLELKRLAENLVDYEMREIVDGSTIFIDKLPDEKGEKDKIVSAVFKDRTRYFMYSDIAEFIEEVKKRGYRIHNIDVNVDEDGIEVSVVMWDDKMEERGIIEVEVIE